ncbi:AAA family ATPase [Ideonella sp. DXS22W]|uniref:AAA family ATPase n=1 Tax=Pseudaquabacterium inlustre TaxID=2984192 RepID=A0ABU9CRL7_9BURK
MRDPQPFDEAAALRAHAARVHALSRPGAVAPGVTLAPAGRPPQRIETHLSTLLLWPERVLKLKKPLCRSFVDFSTAALREAACRHELRLNRRTAPQDYLDVLPVVQTPDGPRITGASLANSDPPLDWAVLMRRFDPQQGFDHLAATGRLHTGHIDALAQQIAQFHQALPPAPAGWGDTETTRHWPRDNLRELAALLPAHDMAAQADLARLAAWTEARGAALAPLIGQRRAAGRVRECHGDLHLGNVVWSEDAPLIFDALEFNEALRQIDTVGELAFAFMDLHAHGLPRLAWRLASAVLEAEDDIAALPLLGWWAAYRAAVRAKVALLADGGPEGQARARQLLALALRLADLAPAPAPPRLVLMMGLSGSGKSRVAAALAEGLGGVRLRSDVERKRLFGLSPQARGGAALGLYAPEAGQRTYARLQALAEAALAAGVPVVVDAASLRRAERDAMRALAARLGRPFTLLLCHAPEAVLRQRLAERQARGDDASDAGPDLLATQAGWAEWPGADEAADTWRLDTATDTVPWPQALEAWLAQAAAP